MATNIVFTRIDNRLVHGQVGVTWTKAVNANLILVANDQAAENPLQQKLMATTADSSGVDIRFFTIKHTIDIIDKAADRQHIFIVIQTPADALKLIKNGVPIKKVNVGNMHFHPGKVEITKKVYIDEKDKSDLLEMIKRGVDVFIEDYPGDKKISVTSNLLNKV